ncbi:uveal autoantigen with coiled-coil domains and ankyrin repeats-like [Saccostrea echinata]|uniref:uveal autoantigen with coiled-coil domains and ankyrin repeats-like n=1 Tax=Saccostrea echinata TaxID=191078 RepID=UPI002A7EDB3B|nr:uveal autoantigen with coiled-coil domains and ankyrin repeats-like [Saccostrea echinata]
MIQKIQILMMDVIGNRNISESLMKRLDDMTEKFHVLEKRQRKSEEENSRLNEELKILRSTIGVTKNLTGYNALHLNETDIPFLKKQISSLHKENHQLTQENTEIKAELEVFIRKYVTEQIKEVDLESLKNQTLFLKQIYEGLSHENERMQKTLLQMNKTINEDRNANDLYARILTAEGNLMTFSAFVNRTMERILQDQNNATQKLMSISAQLSERLLSPPTINSIAFYSYMSQKTPTISVQYSLRFDVVKTNVGNGYHSATGVFIVPETGIYVFTWTIRVLGDNYHSTQLMVNTDVLGVIHVNAGGGGNLGGTGTVVAHVNAGDDIFVRTHASFNKGVIYSDGGGRSSFAGWKLF